MPNIVVVLPTYNEAENLPQMVPHLLTLPIDDLHVLIVDDNSPDGTGAIADELAAAHADRVSVLHRPGKQGLGAAYRAAFRHALTLQPTYIAQMDCDFSHDPDYLPEMVARAAQCDLVLGSRYVEGGSLDPNWGFGRRLLSWWANSIYIRVILRTGVADATGGYRVWKRYVLESIDLDRIRSNGYVFQAEMAYVTERLGYCIDEVPIHFADRSIGASKMDMQIKVEAALRIWQVLLWHHSLKPADRLPVSGEAGSPT
ncbi:MAG: polyprenol monophosphomannose synthase [Anaerolineae bacterium]|nr:polyprenol monophosphomannose synthase [Anaerolineae bacterium]